MNRRKHTGLLLTVSGRTEGDGQDICQEGERASRERGVGVPTEIARLKVACCQLSRVSVLQTLMAC